jgi:hypothetical protein
LAKPGGRALDRDGTKTRPDGIGERVQNLPAVSLDLRFRWM